jgi:predicted GNAT family acetyltransferase
MSALLGREIERSPARVQVLGDADRADLVRLVDADPIVNAVLASRLRAIDTLAPRPFGGAMYGVRSDDGELVAAIFNGGNLLPVGGAAPQWQALAERLREQRRPCTSVVGRADAVQAIWAVLAPTWGPARTIRAVQPLLVIDAATCPPEGDERVRPIRHEELPAYLPAAVAMFSEELGVSPLLGNGAAGEEYRRRVAGLIRAGRAFGILDSDGSVLFKADVGAVSEHTCQVQGVWVRPDARGRGIGTAAMSRVLQHALDLAPTVSLYVNDFNVAARRMYERIGMREVATLTTILF